jgi:hypothetical protein
MADDMAQLILPGNAFDFNDGHDSLRLGRKLQVESGRLKAVEGGKWKVLTCEK